MTRRTQRTAIALLLLGAQSAYSNSTITKWVDDAGHVHYGNATPKANQYHTLQSPPLPSAQEAQAAVKRAVQERQQLSKWEAARPKVLGQDASASISCDRALHIVDFLRGHDELPVLRPTEDGQVVMMAEPDRSAYLEAAKVRIVETCKSAERVDWQELWTGLFWPRTARAGTVTPTQFITSPATPDPATKIKGAKPNTIPANPTTSLIGAKPPITQTPDTGFSNKNQAVLGRTTNSGTFK